MMSHIIQLYTISSKFIEATLIAIMGRMLAWRHNLGAARCNGGSPPQFTYPSGADHCYMWINKSNGVSNSIETLDCISLNGEAILTTV